MPEAVALPLESWGGFYVIVGSTAGALTGLQFVVMTLISQEEASTTRSETISAFGTPNIVHFCAALLIAAILTAPWTALPPAGLAIVGCGIAGVVYSLVVMRRARRQAGYQPVLEDWIWHNILPFVAYVTLLVAGAGLVRGSAGGLFEIGAAALLLMFIGIHNAWDTVAYLVARRGAKARAAADAVREAGARAATEGETRAKGNASTSAGDPAA